ncbi:MAG: hypothetical protein NTV89_17980 [Proteobacteria bacterium]|nr:hypothetical protein [Pseudomonadota bacterium]
MKDKFNIKIILCLTAALMLFCHNAARAENIDPNDDGAQWAWGENVGWFNFDPVQGIGVTVGDSNVTGWVWTENIGWINLSPQQYSGVTNDGSGKLGGWVWGENVGWISFSCLNTDSCATVDYGVTINADGKFDGYAWGENIGWVNFELLSQPDYRVQTAWENAPTLITLASFTATPKAGQVILDWPDRSFSLGQQPPRSTMLASTSFAQIRKVENMQRSMVPLSQPKAQPPKVLLMNLLITMCITERPTTTSWRILTFPARQRCMGR